MKKIIFPFFNKERHGYLSKKAWFRLIVAIYILILLVILCWLSTAYITNNSCDYDNDFYIGDTLMESEYPTCDVVSQVLPALGYSLVFVIVIHYVLQLLFFGIIIKIITIKNKF